MRTASRVTSVFPAFMKRGGLSRAYLSLLLPLLLLSLVGTVARAVPVTLDEIRQSAQGGDVNLQLNFSGPVEKPRSFKIEDPARVVLDFPGVALGLAERNMDVGSDPVLRVTAVESGDRSRVLIHLSRPVGYEVTTQGSQVSVSLGAGFQGSSDASMAVAYSDFDISNVDFRRGEKGEGRISVVLSDPTLNYDIQQRGPELHIEFRGASLPEALDRRLDVLDFATPVREVDTTAFAQGVRMKVSMTNLDYDYLVLQSGNQLIIDVFPVTPAAREAELREKFPYTGELLSLNFQSIAVSAVLQVLADFTGLNLVASDTVSGSVTLRLKNVPWDQAMDIILKSKGLAMRKMGNVVLVAPQSEIAQQERQELELEKELVELEPLETEFIQVNYAKGREIAALLKSKDYNLLSERGNVSVDERTNLLIIQDVYSRLEAISAVVRRLDVPVRQVLIESRIIRADTEFTKDIGVRFGYNQTIDLGDGFQIYGGGTREGTISFGGTGNQATTMGAIPGITTEGSGSFPYIVDLPTVLDGRAASYGLVFGKLGSYLLQLELSALLNEGRGEEIANPKIITTDQGEAMIESGVQVPYQEASSSGATSVSFQDAVLRLKVTPQITPDDRLILDLEVNQDAIGSITVLGTPSIDKNRLQTQVLVNNGETVVLGGIYTERTQERNEGVPYFSEIPYLGALFRRKGQSSRKQELLIFVTPKILSQEF